MAYDTTSTSRRMITAFFDSSQDANEAIERLVQAGIPRSDVTMVAGGESGGSTSGATSGMTTGTSGDSYQRSYDRNEGTGFWDALKDLFLPDEDRYTYAEGLRRGGYLVTARVSDALYERALDILDDEGTIDIDQRAESWRSEGWSGHTAGATSAQGAASSSHLGYGASGGSTGLGTAASVPATPVSGSTAATGTTATGTSAASVPATPVSGSTAATGRSTEATGREESIPIVEERLNVGKRETAGGRVRVRSYVVETPVQEQVSLRQEHVEVERRSVDRPVTDADRLFQERTIEATEKREEAVVSKEARVKEELVVNKEVEQRTQTVQDTVRRTEVEVEDERGRTATSTTTGTDPNRKS